MERLTNQQIADAGLSDWRKLGQAIHARFRSPDPDARARFVAAAMGGEQPLDLRMSTDLIDVAVGTRQAGVWVTPRDLDTARRLSLLAGELGLQPRPDEVTQIELGLDTGHQDTVGPFWSALLTGGPGNTVHDSVLDPTGRVPVVWFQPSAEDPVLPAQRWHFDVWLAPEVADERIALAVAAGGTVVDDTEAPAFAVLADPDGNRVCICTSLGRD